MSDLPEIYDRFELEEQLRDLQQKIDDLKTQVYFTPQSSAPVDVEVGTLTYSDGTNTDNTFGSSTEGFYYYASGTTWTPISVGGSENTIIVQDEGTPLSTSASTLNFVGSGVAATGTGATKTITISSGSAGTDISPVDESSDTTCFPIFVTDATGETRPKTDADSLTYNASTGEIGSKKLNLTDDLTMSGAEKKIDFTNSTNRNDNEPNIEYAGNFLIKSTGSTNLNKFRIVNSGNTPIFNAILETSVNYTTVSGGPTNIRERGIEVFNTVAVESSGTLPASLALGGFPNGGTHGIVYIGCRLDDDNAIGDPAQIILETIETGTSCGSKKIITIEPPDSLNGNATITLPSATGSLVVSHNPIFTGTLTTETLGVSGDVLINGNTVSDRFTGSQTPNIQSGDETMSGHVGEKTICVGATGTVTYTFPDVADGDKGDTWTVVNASTQSITCARSSETEFSKLVAGSDPATATSVTISKGGVAEFVVTAPDVISVFGTGIS